MARGPRRGARRPPPPVNPAGAVIGLAKLVAAVLFLGLVVAGVSVCGAHEKKPASSSR